MMVLQVKQSEQKFFKLMLICMFKRMIHLRDVATPYNSSSFPFIVSLQRWQ